MTDLNSVDLDEVLDQIYDHYDGLFRAGKFGLVDDELRRTVVEDHSVDVLLGILTATLPGCGALVERGDFFRRVEAHFKSIGRDDPRLLSGLDERRGWSRFAEQYYAWERSQEFPKAPTRAEVQAEMDVLRAQVAEDAKAWV